MLAFRGHAVGQRVLFPRAGASKLPIVLSPEEVELFFHHVGCLKHRAALTLCYGAGLRISEAVKIRVSDLDSKRMLIRVEQGKGRKDRLWAATHKAERF
jgi:site-specific recombinase XerD